MKKYLLFFSLFLFFFLAAQAQNLVPNPSFEDTVACPTTLDQIYNATGWSSYSISPDYYNVCNGGFLSVPENVVGYQLASSGEAYTGFIGYDVNGFVREIIGRQLSQNLVIGQQYFVSIKVSLAEYTSSFPQFIPCNKIGVKFSTTSFSTTNPVPINNYAHVYTDSIISDTMNWTTIRGSFIADSSYQYIMLGNFFDDAQTDTVSTPNGVKSYFFIDAICVSTDSLYCATGIPTEVPTGEFLVERNINIFPNPCSAILSVELKEKDESLLTISTITGQKVFTQNFTGKIVINTSTLPGGIYFISLQSKKQITNYKIIIKKF
ncbi:MAG TPA: T9SS type A sorting domain-containing protein [Bacteroidia bacterium]|nr:T9SS type A sorting domain-containing protein [Bacteroidia bacterium]